jgi:hypothetical protein
MTYAMVLSCFVTLFGGVLYDLLGRKATVTIMFMVAAVSSVFIPFGKDLHGKVWYFNFFKTVFFASFVPLLMNPFINDYVKV